MEDQRTQISKKIHNATFGEGYNHKLFVLVPPEHQLIQRDYIRNTFSIKNSGLRFVRPFCVSRIIDMREGYVDYPPFEFMTKNNIVVKVDLVVATKLVKETDDKKTKENILNALYNNKNIYEHIYFVIRDRLTPLFKTLTYEEIAKLDISDRSKDALKSLYDSFDEIKKYYGIEITQFTKKEVSISDELKRVYAEKDIAEKRNQAILKSAKAKVEVTRREAEAKKILAEAEAEANFVKAMKENEIKADLITKLADNGILDEAGILKLMEIMAVSGNDNAKVIATLGDSGLASTVAQLSAIYNQVKQDDENPKQKILIPNSNQNK